MTGCAKCLKACPNCQSTSVDLIRNEDGYWKVECAVCGHSSPKADEKWQAKEIWQRNHLLLG